MAKIIVALLAVCLLSFPLFGQEEVEELQPLNPPGELAGSGEAVNETTGVWFIELSSPPVADGSSLKAVQNEKNSFRSSAKKAGVAYTERYAYDVLFNGLSVEMDLSEVAKVSRLSGVKRVWPVVTESLPPVTREAEGDMYTASAITGADIVRNSLGFTGAGIKVAVMDTGVDYDHPDLGGCFGPGCRVSQGYDFVGDAFNADPTSPSYNPIRTPDSDPDDCGGHGTHVAGIIGANGTLTGVAPDVTFGAYRVFGCAGSTTADVMIAAMERILGDGMQILNMSIGSSFQWPEYPTAKAATRLVNKGVVVVASIGNSGTSGLYAAGAPGVGEKVIGVASVENTHFRLKTFTVSPDATPIGYNAATAAPAPPTSGTFPMARTGTATATADACAALPAGSLTGKVALIRRGTCSFNVKANFAELAGAAGVVIYNNAAGIQSITVAGPPAITIPVVSISDVQGLLLDSRLASGPVDMTWTNVTGSFPNLLGGLISDFSSYGLAPDLTLKPDLSAPGGAIYSTYPLERGGYASLNGTSMASPHTAGAVALLLQAQPKTPSNAVRDILQNNASPKPWWGNPGLGYLDMVHRQGAGTLRIDAAIQAQTKIEPGKLSLGESESGPATRTLTVTNNSASPVTYNLSHAPALSSGSNTFTVAATTGFASVGVSSPSITVPAKSSVTVDVTIAANSALAERSTYGGYLVFTPVGGGQVLRVPYAGLKGDYQSFTVLTPTVNGFPWLAQVEAGSYWKRAAGGTYTMAGADIPYILVHLDHQSRRLRGEVFDASTGKAMHRAFDDEYVGRNSGATGFFAIGWDGITTAGNRTYTLPNGTYVLKLSVLKALGDESNPAHWETWTSPAITIARP